jgi:hypothetical protein
MRGRSILVPRHADVLYRTLCRLAGVPLIDRPAATIAACRPAPAGGISFELAPARATLRSPTHAFRRQ